MPPAARIGDMHTCPMVTPGVPPVPHVGGPILPPGCPTVLIGGQPAARATDMCTCVGPPDAIAMGSPTVLIGNLMAARMGDPTTHGGVIVIGCPDGPHWVARGNVSADRRLGVSAYWFRPPDRVSGDQKRERDIVEQRQGAQFLGFPSLTLTLVFSAKAL